MHETGPEANPRILLICGEPCDLTDRAAQLAQAGWTPIRVPDDQAAGTAMASGPTALVVICELPVEGIGPNRFKRLRGLTCDGWLPVLVLAEDPSNADICRMLDGGADDVISSRASAGEFQARIRSALRSKRFQDELLQSRRALKEALEREGGLLAQLRRDNAHLQHLATTDPLTHVQNVRSFREILAHEFRIARRYEGRLSLLTVDVDHFKVVNDTHGHPSGDYVLKELAVILTRSVRESDVVCRTGGEEFSVILPRANARQTARFAQRIRREVAARKFIVYGREIHITISIGWANYPADAQIDGPRMLLYFADQALLVAKESGRDCVVASSQLPPAVQRRLWRQYRRRPDVNDSRKDSQQSASVVPADSAG